MILKFSDYEPPKIDITYNVNNYDYGCLMFCLEFDNWNELLKEIDDNDIYNDESNKYGLEDEPHITILFGFQDNIEFDIKSDIINDIKKLKLPKIKILKPSYFENDEYHVLKYEIQSNELNKMNHYFCKNYEYFNSYPIYLPHITIAYLNKNKSKNYINIFNKWIDKLDIENSKRYFRYTSPNNYDIIYNIDNKINK